MLDLENLIEEYPFLKDCDSEKITLIKQQIQLFLQTSRIWLVDLKKYYSNLTPVFNSIEHFINKEKSLHDFLMEHNDDYYSFMLAQKEKDVNFMFHYLPRAIEYTEDRILFAIESYQEERGYI